MSEGLKGQLVLVQNPIVYACNAAATQLCRLNRVEGSAHADRNTAVMRGRKVTHTSAAITESLSEALNTEHGTGRRY